jgi:hypothetical protein
MRDIILQVDDMDHQQQQFHGAVNQYIDNATRWHHCTDANFTNVINRLQQGQAERLAYLHS